MKPELADIFFDARTDAITHDEFILASKIRLFIALPLIWGSTALFWRDYYVPETSPNKLTLAIELWWVLAVVSLVADFLLFATRKKEVPRWFLHVLTFTCVACVIIANQLVGSQFGSVSTQTLINIATMIAVYRLLLGYRYALFITLFGITLYFGFSAMEATGVFPPFMLFNDPTNLPEYNRPELAQGILAYNAFIFVLIFLLSNWGMNRVVRLNQSLDQAYQNLKATQAKMMVESRFGILGRITVGIAHEIGNPLSFISGGQSVVNGGLEKLRASAGDALSPGLHRVLDDVEEGNAIVTDGVDRIVSVIRSLNAFTEMREETEAMALDVREAIEASTCVFKEVFARDFIEFETSIEHSHLVWASPADISQAIQCILQHSLEALSSGDSVQITSRSDDVTVTIAIQDSGSGIAEEEKDFIFDPLYIARSAQTKSGTELAVAQKTVHNNNGDLVLVSPNNPTRFEIRLPVHTPSNQNT